MDQPTPDQPTVDQPTVDQPTPDQLTVVSPAPRRGVVDVQLTLSTLMCLDDDPALVPGFGPVIAEIARQVALDQETNPAWKFSVTDEHGVLAHHGHLTRRPSAAEQAFVKARDRTCRAPGCTRAAKHCDDDHRQPYSQRGPSHRGNLIELCRRHHRYKHKQNFIIHQISVGTYLWDKPNGRRYLVTPNGDLILTADDLDPPPPPGYVRQYLPD